LVESRIMSDSPAALNRASVVAAVADYILQVNYKGYRPDRRKVVAVRCSDRSAWLRDAGTPVRQEVWYYVEGELFPTAGATRLQDGQTPEDLAASLVAGVWDDLWVWNGYDFTPTSGGLDEAAYAAAEARP
jgi:hypothetical protein